MTRPCDTLAETRMHTLTRAAVAAATLDVIDDLGLHAATMRAIADRLGIKAQSLYTHIDSREDLLDAVADHIVNEVDTDPAVRRDPTDPWQLHLTATAHAVRRCAHRHPHAFVLLATRPPRLLRSEPRLLSYRWAADILAIFTRSGFADDDITFAHRAFDAFLLGSLLIETRDLANDAAAAAQTHLRAQPAHPSMPTHNHRLSDLTHQHDDNFENDLHDVINRITTTTITPRPSGSCDPTPRTS